MYKWVVVRLLLNAVAALAMTCVIIFIVFVREMLTVLNFASSKVFHFAGLIFHFVAGGMF